MQKYPVSYRALIARVNRKLKHDGEMLKVSRSPRCELTTGDLYVVDFQRNLIAQTHVDLESFASELGVLKTYERLKEE